MSHLHSRPFWGLGGFISLLIIILSSCAGNGNQSNADISADSLFAISDSVLADTLSVSDTITIKYAKGLSISYEADGIHVSISNPDPQAKRSRKEDFVITHPSHRFICTTALQLGNFEALGLEDNIVGMNSLRNIFSPRMKQQLHSGKTAKIGKEGNFDIETVIALQPDYIFVSASKHGGYDALLDCGVPLISHHGYKETHPLGQAEWIKLIGVLTGETRRANAVFNDIERKYLKLKAEVAAIASNDSTGNTHSMPTVLSGRQLRDGWYLMGGKSYMAQMFSDAGVSYIFSDVDDTGGTTMDFEAAYARGIDADFWQMDGAFDGDFTLADLKAEDERYADIAAFKKKKVLFCNLSQTPYRELSPVEPHRVLADFVKAFHPEVLPHYTPKYYKIIK